MVYFSMSGTKHNGTSFAAPTADDLAAWNALPEEEKRAAAKAELAKGMSGNTQPLTTDLKYRIFSRALTRSQTSA
jgi:hypothetical protein